MILEWKLRNLKFEEYEIEFGEDAAKTLQQNFYVDDMLKLSLDIETAIDLISRVCVLQEVPT